MFLSIFIPVYGVEKYIERCAVSLFEQTLRKDVEFIFVNDCSKDRSMEILQEVMQRYPLRKNQIILLQHDENRGSAAARQTALEYATGDYVLTVDSDDWLELDACEQLYRKIHHAPCDIVVFDYYVDYRRKSVVSKQPIMPHGKECLELVFTGKLHGSTCNKLIRRDLFLKNNIRYVEGLNMMEDISVVFRLFFFADHVEKLDRPFYHYFQGNHASYTTCISSVSQRNMLQLLTLVEDFFVSNRPSDRLANAFSVFRRRVYLLLLQSADNYFVYKEYCHKLKKIGSQRICFLSATERCVFFCGKFMPCKVSYCFILLLKVLKARRYKIYNR